MPSLSISRPTARAADEAVVVARLPRLRAVYAAEVGLVVAALAAAVAASVRQGALTPGVVVATLAALGLVALLGCVVHEVVLTHDGRLIARAPLRRSTVVGLAEVHAVRWASARMAVVIEYGAPRPRRGAGGPRVEGQAPAEDGGEPPSGAPSGAPLDASPAASSETSDVKPSDASPAAASRASSQGPVDATDGSARRSDVEAAGGAEGAATAQTGVEPPDHAVPVDDGTGDAGRGGDPRATPVDAGGQTLLLSWRLAGVEVIVNEVQRRRPDLPLTLPLHIRRRLDAARQRPGATP